MVFREMRDGCTCCGTFPCQLLPHEPATCPDLEQCEHCVGWLTGYGVGKEKAHAELRAGVWVDHHDACRCHPCETVRAILSPKTLRASLGTAIRTAVRAAANQSRVRGQRSRG